jgi:dihydrofolate reductase
MSMLVAELAMSLDGFVADADDGMLQPGRPGAAGPREAVGAVICGRRTFDITGGWCGHHPLDAPAFVVTHSVPYGWPRQEARVSFVTDGIESALQSARAAAAGRTIAVASPSLARQYLDAGLLDEIHVSVIPMLLGEGVRFFAGLTGAPIQLESKQVVNDTLVTHLAYRVRRSRR